MNLKQFNFYSTRRVNCLLVEKRQPGLGRKRLQKRRDKERKRKERGGYFVTQVHTNKNVPSPRRDESSSRRRSETKFYQRERENFFILLRDAEKGKRKTKESARVRFLFFLERERGEGFFRRRRRLVDVVYVVVAGAPPMTTTSREVLTRLRLIVVPRRRIFPSSTSSTATQKSLAEKGGRGKDGGEDTSTSLSSSSSTATTQKSDENIFFFIHASAIREPNPSRYERAVRVVRENEEKDALKRFTPLFVNSLKEKASAYASRTWQTWEKSEKGFGRKVYDIAQKLLERVDPDEDVLKAIPSKALGATLSSCEIVYPKSLMHADDVRVAIRDLLKRGKKKARRAKYFNLACAPFTLPLFLSPVSNFPIYWFLYRAREAWIGCKGAESAKEILQRRLEQPELIGEDDREIQKLTEFECTRSSDNEDDGNKSTEACCRIAAHDESNCAVTFAPCNKLDEVFGSFSSSFASDEKKLNFWRRLTAVQLDSTEIEDNYEMNFVRALGEIEKLTGANDMVSLHKRYERFRALNAK
jgi:hypothetical protein